METESEFLRAYLLGYEYFQGYFFDRPVILQSERVPESHVKALRLVKQTQRDELDFLAVEELIAKDVSLSRSLLTYVNSAAFEWAGAFNRYARVFYCWAPTKSANGRGW